MLLMEKLKGLEEEEEEEEEEGRNELLDDFQETRRYWKVKEEAIERSG
jgi:hypothetical protein